MKLYLVRRYCMVDGLRAERPAHDNPQNARAERNRGALPRPGRRQSKGVEW
jgi:hypothetical protein